MGSWMDRAAEMAYRLLVEDAPACLPVNVTELIRAQNGVELLTYAQAALLLDITQETWRWEAPSPDAFTLIEHASTPTRYKVFFDDTKPIARIRFTLAHELGHLLFHHAGWEPFASEAVMDCFARHLLCPPALIPSWEASALPEDWLCRAFGLSPAAVQRLRQSPCGRADALLEQRLCEKFSFLLTPP